MNEKVEKYVSRLKTWQAETTALCAICLHSGLVEELKWGNPCYSLEQGNVVLIHSFKEYCALLFFKGALLKDSQHILIQQTENVQSARQVRFTNLQEIVKLEKVLKAYIREAIAVEKSGLKVEFKKVSQYPVAAEFQVELDKNRALKTAFAALTPGRQRGYLLYFAAAKQAKTRAARVDKCLPRIIDGLGLDD